MAELLFLDFFMLSRRMAAPVDGLSLIVRDCELVSRFFLKMELVALRLLLLAESPLVF